MNTQELERFDLGAPSYHYTARIISESRDTALREHVLQAARQRAAAPTDTLDPEQLFTWSALISNQTLDSWNTKMAESSLSNYAADAKDGVAFMNSHRHMELPVGYSVDGLFEAQGAGGTPGAFPRTMADFYTVRGVNLNGLPTDEFIKGVQYGLVRDVSIGFKEGEGFSMTCSICGLDWYDWDCYHIPGETYKVVTNPDADPDNQQTVDALAFSWVNNARLSEVSAVYDGATPNAGITKLMREARGGRLKPDVLRMLESKYRIHLPETPKQFRGYSNNQQENDMSEGKGNPGTGTSGAPDTGGERVSDKVRAFVRSLGIKDVSISDVTTPEAAIEAANAEFQRLRALEPRAAEGEKLRKALIEGAIKEGNRAFGAEFNAEAKQRMLENLDVDSITEMCDAWRTLGDAKFAEMKTRASGEQADGTGTDEDKGDKGEGGQPGEPADTPEEAILTEDAEGGV